ncbi:MAG: hypothetical protein PHD31_01865, partial [Candidatus Pacebacteria bacterium]|nr:hypothetical protein [Candidatus Paceibacterota bacterium]
VKKYSDKIISAVEQNDIVDPKNVWAINVCLAHGLKGIPTIYTKKFIWFASFVSETEKMAMIDGNNGYESLSIKELIGERRVIINVLGPEKTQSAF